jgi:hypothetical protein
LSSKKPTKNTTTNVWLTQALISQELLTSLSKKQQQRAKGVIKYFISYGITALKKHAPHHQIEHLVNSLLSAGEGFYYRELLLNGTDNGTDI